MKTTLKSAIILVGILISFGAGAVSAQEKPGLGSEALKMVVKSFVEELAKDETLRKQVVKELMQSAGPEMAALAARSVSGTGSLGANSQTVSRDTREINAISQIASRIGLSTISSASASNPKTVASNQNAKPRNNYRFAVNAPGNETVSRRNLVTIVTNTSSPVNSLTVEEVKKVFSGEYTNWNQVGGPDLPIKLILWRDNVEALEDLIGTEISPEASRVMFLSLMIPSVDRTKGAIGFLPTREVEQLEFVVRHTALKKIALKSGDSEQGEVGETREAKTESAFAKGQATYKSNLKSGSAPIQKISIPIGRTALETN
jgi:hypothetical protein